MRELYEGMIQGVLAKLPAKEGPLPIFHWEEIDGRYLSVSLLTAQQSNGARFFHEMVYRWLLPGKKLHIVSSFSSDFWDGIQHLTLCELVIGLKDESELPIIRAHQPILEAEIRLGLLSVYHANRILEIRGLSADEKTALIQEKIVLLSTRWPRIFDSDVFAQMQHFLVMCSEEFKSARRSSHLTRMIVLFYLFEKAFQAAIEEDPVSRHVRVKLNRTEIELPLGTKRVLSVIVGLNLLSSNEVFEKKHLLKALQEVEPTIVEVPDSFFMREDRETRTVLLYIEVEVVDAKMLQELLPNAIKNGVERLVSPLFMPRNEEEVMRNIITLARQLCYPRDLPQVVLSFDEQKEGKLVFTIVLLRVFHKGMPSIQELFLRKSTFLQFIPDRVKSVGMLRKKYPKEATVFRVKLSGDPFLRQDHSVDLLRARQVVLEELQQVVGEVRDYNGGMIAKQREQIERLKTMLSTLTKQEEVLLENFFHSIFPVELRSVLPLPLLHQWFVLLLDGTKVLKKDDVLYVVGCEKKVVEEVSSLQIPSSQLALLFGKNYFGFALQNEAAHQGESLHKLRLSAKIVGHDE